jgi:hypothetical protein
MLADHTLSIPALTDAYALKSALYGFISGGEKVERVERSFLYGRCPVDGSVIIRSSDAKIAALSTDTRPVPQPQVGETYDFVLRASPMVDAPHGRQPAEPHKWLNDRLDQIGIELITVHHRASWTWCGKRSDHNPGFYLPDVVFVGRLLVRDAAKLTNALVHGIGRHRAFGFGLMQLF